MFFTQKGDRWVAPNRSGNQGDPDEKVTAVELYLDGDKVKVKFEDGEEKQVPISDLLVDQDHQTCLNPEEHGDDHLIMLSFKPNVAIDPDGAAMTGLTKMNKIRLDQLVLIMEAVHMYPSVGSAIDQLVRNIPKK